VGFSALNYEAHATHVLAKRTKEFDPKIITVFGGPYALKNARTILEDANALTGFLKDPPTEVLLKALLRLAQGSLTRWINSWHVFSQARR
jgi:hypothetical protein